MIVMRTEACALQDAQMRDNGTYHCDASNKFDNESASSVLIVRGVCASVISDLTSASRSF